MSPADYQEIVELIDELRAEEGASILICCKNPDFNGHHNERIICQAAFTRWKEEAFEGDTLVQALRIAASALHRRPPKTRLSHPIR